MAWDTHFNGKRLGRIEDDSYEEFLMLARTAIADGRGVMITCTGDPYERVALWTPGTPITFDYFDGVGYESSVALV